MWLNIQRYELACAVRVARGSQLDPEDELPPEYGDAVCPLEEEVEEYVFKENTGRQLRRVLRNRGMM